MSDLNRYANYENDFLKNLLYQMLLIRRFEESAAKCYGLKKIGGFCHIYIGQEAVCAGAISTIDIKKDYVITAYRDHGHAISVGMEPNVIMAELFGKINGCSRGKGGSMHLFDVTRNFYGGHGIVGAHIPLAAGMAYRIKFKEEDGVVLCFFGDGAIHQGSFHEALNMASYMKLPVIYICENNQYGMGTDYRRVSAVDDFSKMAASYNIPGKQINGMDVIEVHEKVKEVVENAKKGKGPSLLEIKTYRYMGHSMSDPAKYRTKEELDQYKGQDPIAIFKDDLIKLDMISEDEYKAKDSEIKNTVKKAVEFAESSPQPDLETLYEDVVA